MGLSMRSARAGALHRGCLCSACSSARYVPLPLLARSRSLLAPNLCAPHAVSADQEPGGRWRQQAEGLCQQLAAEDQRKDGWCELVATRPRAGAASRRSDACGRPRRAVRCRCHPARLHACHWAPCTLSRSLCARSHPRPGIDGPSYLGLTSFFLGRDVNDHDVQHVFNEGGKHAGGRKRQEIVPETQLEPMVVELLRRFREVNGMPPQRVLFYRDGVGDSQFGDVMHHEVCYATSISCASKPHLIYTYCYIRSAPSGPLSRACDSARSLSSSSRRSATLPGWDLGLKVRAMATARGKVRGKAYPPCRRVALLRDAACIPPVGAHAS